MTPDELISAASERAYGLIRGKLSLHPEVGTDGWLACWSAARDSLVEDWPGVSKGVRVRALARLHQARAVRVR